ncbi:MAG TPA: NAD(P)H-dependent oxidoreductase subunit E [Verrucomicrobiales bacterium]|nr:NAD(P)H-dependent oxidoreductase subunit E [Verrucomicrobiales bacterium]
MSFAPSDNLKKEVAELLTHYPEGEQRSASLMVLHAIQSETRYISKEAMQWAAGEIGIKPLNLYELVTFYPMLREEQPGRYVLKVCRTLSCALAGSMDLHKNLCTKLKLDPKKHGMQTTEDGKFSIEFAECLASCGTGPVMMCNDDFYEAVNEDKTDEILGGCQ